MPSKAVVFVVASFLLVALITSPAAKFDVFAAKPYVGAIACFALHSPPGYVPAQVTCCQTTYYPNGLEIRYCTDCDNTQPPSNCGPRYQAHGGGNQSGTALPTGNNTGAVTNGQTGLPNRLRTALLTGNNTGAVKHIPAPGNTCKTIPCFPPGFGNTSNTTCVTLSCVVPVNHTNALPTGNNTGTTPPALKLSQPSLAGQQPQTQQATGHHHHKGSNLGTSTSGGNSTKK